MDIWEDAATLRLLRHVNQPPELDQKHTTQRASRYQVQGQELNSLGMDGKPRLVPKPLEHVEIYSNGRMRRLDTSEPSGR